jgi:glycosyltransferase involved in cell wall biosynthesis
MQFTALKDHFDITTAGFTPINDPKAKFIRLTHKTKKAWFNFHLNFPALLRIPFSLLNKIQFSLAGQHIGFSVEDHNLLSEQKYDLIICHHPNTLEMGFKLRSKYNCKLIFNAHEIYPYEFENDEAWMQANFERIDNLLKMYLNKCDAVFTVNKEISEFYSERYGCKALAIHNSKPFKDLASTPVQTPIRIIHHGGAMPERKLEQMADAVLACGNKYSLTFMLMNTNTAYLEKLKAAYENKGVEFLEPVPYDKIIEAINKYDLGLYILPNDTINHDLALPNKVFEFVQAKLALVVSPNKAMTNMVLNYGIGKVSAGFDAKSMADLLKDLNREEILGFKQRAKEVSQQLSSQADEKLIFNTVKSLLSSSN